MVTKKNEEGQNGLTLAQRLLNAGRDVRIDEDQDKNSHQGFKYTSWKKVYKDVRKALFDNGIIFVPSEEPGTFKMEFGKNNSGKNIVIVQSQFNFKFINVDDPTDVIEFSRHGYSTDTGDFATGKMASYAIKFALRDALIMNIGDPDVENGEIVSEGPTNFGTIPGELSPEELAEQKAQQQLNSAKHQLIAWMVKEGIVPTAEDASELIKSTPEYRRLTNTLEQLEELKQQIAFDALGE